MNIRELFVKTPSKDKLELFDYYKKLGLSDNQSMVLSLFIYGNICRMNYKPAFDFYRELYFTKYKETGISFCDYIADVLLSTVRQKSELYIENALRNSEDYLKYQKECDERLEKEREEIRNSARSNINAFGSSMIYKTTSASFGKKAKAMDMACMASPSLEGESSLNFCAMDSVASNIVERCCSAPIKSPEKTSSLARDIFDMINKDLKEKLSTDRYELIEEKGFLSPLTSPTSTFRMTNNTAAFGVLRNNLTSNRKIDASMVRIEELLNNFVYDLSKPTKRVFNINTQVCKKPNSDNKLLFVGVQGKDIIPTRQNITLLLDTSGSMRNNNLNTQLAMITIVSKLKDNDVLSLVTYSDIDHTIFANWHIDTKTSMDNFIENMYQIDITGCTYGSKGIMTAYDLTKKTYIEDGINRVILMTDGDLNFGITDKGGLKDLILDRKDNGIFLSVLGTGLYNYKDDILELLSKHGNGNYCTIDSLIDVKENIDEKYNSLVYTIAKDVKAQVEFNPKFVKKYRLIGYENRMLSHEDFKDDTVISEPYGCGGYGVALYELEMQDGASEIKSDLRYQQPVLTNDNNICTVSVRYKEPLGTESEELSVNVKNKDGKLENNILLAYMIYVICEKLRNSKYITDEDRNSVEELIYKYGIGELYDINKDKIKVMLALLNKK